MQTVLITGVSDGIGLALARHCAHEGARVFGVGRRPYTPSLTGVVQPDDYCRTDLSLPYCAEIVDAFLDGHHIECLDVLIHNAGIGWYGPVQTQNSASIDSLLATNLRAPIALTHALLPRLVVADGAIAFVSSVHSTLPAPDFATYTASKAALDAFVRNLRIELQNKVAVISVWPGATRTGMHVKSGVPANLIRADRYASPEYVAAQIALAVRQRHSRAIGASNRLQHWTGLHLEPVLDRALIMIARRRGG